MDVTTECLNSIKVLKLYSWEGVFNHLIGDTRTHEMKALTKRIYFIAFSMASFVFFPFQVKLACFVSYIGFGNYISVASATYVSSTI